MWRLPNLDIRVIVSRSAVKRRKSRVDALATTACYECAVGRVLVWHAPRRRGDHSQILGVNADINHDEYHNAPEDSDGRNRSLASGVRFYSVTVRH